MNKIHSIDTLKFVCAILVVLIHTPTSYQAILRPLTSVAVPCFFIISGYLLYSNNMADRLKKNIKKIIWIIIWSTCLYAIVSVINICRGGSWELLSSKSIIRFILFNENPFGYHLWYLSAYLYVLLIVYALSKLNFIKILWYITPILLLGDLALGKYSDILWGRTFDYIYVRNFLFVGLPYFAIGMWLKRTPRLSDVATRWWIIFTILFLATSFAERAFIINSGHEVLRQHFLSTTFLSVSLFMLFLSLPQKGENTISKIGSMDALYIYILHPLIIFGFSILKIAKMPGYEIINPILVILFLFPTIFLFRKIRLIK